MSNLNPGDSPKSGGPVSAEQIADLAAASRVLVAQGVVDAFGHVSMRHPHAPECYLMARSIAPALVTPDDIIEYDLDSNPCNANGRSSFLKRFIHGEIYKARSDIHSIVHSHSPSVIPFGLVGVPMQAMFHNAAFIAEGVPVFDIRKRFGATDMRSEEHTSELQSPCNLVCRLLLEKKKKNKSMHLLYPQIRSQSRQTTRQSIA